LVQTGLNELGYWQLSRAQEKQVRLEALNKPSNQKISDLTQVTQQDINDFAHVELSVNLAVERNLLLENKIQGGELGYHILNLVEDSTTGQLFLVNRGWIAGRARRDDLPSIDLPLHQWDITGRLYQINPQILSSDATVESYGSLLRLPVLDSHIVSIIEQRFDKTIEPYLVRLEPEVESTFAIDWAWLNMSPEKHLAYAFQWFGLAFTFLIVSIVVLIKKEKK
jgi:surfeit locus 1 family protein